VFCSDITKIKDVEKREQKIRATFFSSVAHELRTPLNSILPLILVILEELGKISGNDRSKAKIEKLLRVV
jgi:K+-sensing histidine kinase KdpD